MDPFVTVAVRPSAKLMFLHHNGGVYGFSSGKSKNETYLHFVSEHNAIHAMLQCGRRDWRWARAPQSLRQTLHTCHDGEAVNGSPEIEGPALG